MVNWMYCLRGSVVELADMHESNRIQTVNQM